MILIYLVRLYVLSLFLPRLRILKLGPCGGSVVGLKGSAASVGRCNPIFNRNAYLQADKGLAVGVIFRY